MNDYRILGVSPNDSYEKIKAQWRRLCKMYHPDNKITGNSENFRLVNEAFKRISDNINSKTIPDEKGNIDAQGILDDYIFYGLKKYRDIHYVINYLKTYMDGVEQAITNDENYRDLFKKYLSPDEVRKMVNGDIHSYITVLVDTKDYKFDIFMAACKATYRKFSREQLIAALDAVVLTNSFCYFTNDGRKLREKLEKNVRPYEIQNYLVSLLNGNITAKESLGRQAVDELISKFNVYHEARTR